MYLGEDIDWARLRVFGTCEQKPKKVLDKSKDICYNIDSQEGWENPPPDSAVLKGWPLKPYPNGGSRE
jgi:hypothetical protein